MRKVDELKIKTMNLLDINESQLKALSRVGCNLSHYWLLHMLYEAEIVVRIPAIREKKLLEDRGLINKTGLTIGGREFYEQIRDTQLETPVGKKKEEAHQVDNGWENWWKTYPSASFYYKGIKFESSRSLKTNKSVCEQLYNKVITTGVKPEQLLNALNHQVNLMKKESWESGKNKLEYMTNSETYLRQERFQEFLTIGEEQDEQPTDNCWA